MRCNMSDWIPGSCHRTAWIDPWGWAIVFFVLKLCNMDKCWSFTLNRTSRLLIAHIMFVITKLSMEKGTCWEPEIPDFSIEFLDAQHETWSARMGRKARLCDPARLRSLSFHRMSVIPTARRTPRQSDVQTNDSRCKRQAVIWRSWRTGSLQASRNHHLLHGIKFWSHQHRGECQQTR